MVVKARGEDWRRRDGRGILLSMDTIHRERLTYIGKTTFRRQGRLFGIREPDRFSHLYLIGRTGTGKSTLLGTMALQDLAAGRGLALLDPPTATWWRRSSSGCLLSAETTCSTSTLRTPPPP